MLKKLINIFPLCFLMLNICLGQDSDLAVNNFQKAEDYFKEKKYDSAYALANKALTVAKNDNNDTLELNTLELLFKITLKTNVDKNHKFFKLAEQKAAKLKKPLVLGKLYNLKANYHYTRFEDNVAMAYYIKTDSVFDKNKIQGNTQISALLNIAELIMQSGIDLDSLRYKRAKNNLIKALKIANSTGEKDKLLNIHLKLGALSGRVNNDSLAMYHLWIAKSIAEKQNDPTKTSNVYWQIASSHLKKKEIDSAQFYYKKRVAILENTTYVEELALALSGLGGFYNRTNQFDKGIISQEKALELFNKAKTEKKGQVLGTLNGLATAYAGAGNYKMAYETLDKAYLLEDSLNLKKNQNISLELETKYQTEKKEQEIALLTAQKELEAKQKTNQRNLFLALLGVILIVSGFIFYAYHNKLKTAQKLKELDTLKSRFFANISHEFRTPLTLIKSPLQSVMEAETSEEKTQKLQLVNQNANRMLELVDQLLELSKLDSGSLKPILKKADLDAFIKTLIAPFRYEAGQKNLAFSSHINIHPKEHWIDRDILEKITANLLSNALKYTPENEKVHVGASAENHWLKLQVQNTGNTLSKAETSKIFERFYQKNDNNPGVGIGLALVKELVELYKGTVDVENQQGSLTFYITLPLDKEVLKDVAIISEDTAVEVPTVSTVVPDEDAPLLLIADDNAAIRQVVADVFASEYKILEAVNGKEALKIAKKEVPDLIISDVMMPEMDGFELTNALKNDEVTSFVPVVLLTAKTGDEAHLQALNNQADAYVTKPFNNQVLKATVQQLLAERSKLRERFSKELVLKPMDVVLNSADEKFMAKLQTIIDEKLQNPDFSAEEFAETVGMSRMQLHRKLKSLTGFSATEFIRKERLKMAAELLKNKALNVSEVAFAVGFNDADYFTKCFKEAYGVTPSRFS